MMNKAEVIAALEDLNPYQLALQADCSSPDTVDSAGAKFLTSVRDAVVEAIDNSDDGTVDQDDITEIADGAPDVYTFTRWQEFVDLAAWQEDPEELGGGENGDMTQMAGICLFIIADRLANALINEFPIDDEDAEDDDDDDTDA